MLSPELIGSIGTALTGILAAIAAFTATRNRRVTEDRKALRRQEKLQRLRINAALSHIDKLERRLSGRGLPVPARPAILEVDEGDDEPSARAPASSDAT